MKEAVNRVMEETGGEQGHLSSTMISETGDKRSGSPNKSRKAPSQERSTEDL